MVKELISERFRCLMCFNKSTPLFYLAILNLYKKVGDSNRIKQRFNQNRGISGMFLTEKFLEEIYSRLSPATILLKNSATSFANG